MNGRRRENGNNNEKEEKESSTATYLLPLTSLPAYHSFLPSAQPYHIITYLPQTDTAYMPRYTISRERFSHLCRVFPEQCRGWCTKNLGNYIECSGKSQAIEVFFRCVVQWAIDGYALVQSAVCLSPLSEELKVLMLGC